MSDLTIKLGKRIRSYRLKQGLSQERLAEYSGCHPTYIGQIERGEKNATMDSIERICTALNISMSELFDKISSHECDETAIPLKCYELLLTKTKNDQQRLYNILLEIEKYRNNSKQ